MVNILQYDAESAVVKELGQTFTLEYPDIHWYNTAEKYIYFAYENKSTSFTNIGFIDVSTNQRITVDNAHKLKVTGIVHIGDLGNQPIVLSSSMEGTIKAWKIEGAIKMRLTKVKVRSRALVKKISCLLERTTSEAVDCRATI